jgi:hypothetical protein
MSPINHLIGSSMTDSRRQLYRRASLVLVVALLIGVMGCQHRVTVDPIRVEPLHVTLDITLRVDRELDDFFAFEDPGQVYPDEAPLEETPEGAPS